MKHSGSYSPWPRQTSPSHNFCLMDCQDCILLGQPEPISRLWSPTGPKGAIGIIFQLDGIPYRLFPPTGSEIVATTGSDHLMGTVLVSCIEHDPLGLNVRHLPLAWAKFCHRWELELFLTGDSSGRSQETLRICLGLPGRTGIFPTVRANAPPGGDWLTAFAALSPKCLKRGRKSDNTTTKLIIKCLPRVSWCQVHIRTPLCFYMVVI